MIRAFKNSCVYQRIKNAIYIARAGHMFSKVLKDPKLSLMVDLWAPKTQ